MIEKTEAQILRTRRHNARRRGLDDYIPLNDEFEGSTGHHIDTEHVIYIPSELHKQFPHDLQDHESMKQINNAILQRVYNKW